MTTERTKLYVRFSNLDDYDKLMEFYEKHAHKNVTDRSNNLMRELSDKGSIVIIEDALKGDIIGASVSYPCYGEGKNGEEQKWLEVGTTRIVLNGYPGLFDAMIAMQSLRAYLVEPPTELFVCKIRTQAVKGMAAKLGWRAFEAPEELTRFQDRTFDDGIVGGSEDWMCAGMEAFPVMAQYFCDVLDKGGVLKHVKTGQEIELDFSKSKFFNIFEAEIRDLAKQSYGDPDAPDRTCNIAQTRDKWMHRYFK